MLSIDLFNSRYEKKLHEGAVDDAIAHLIEPLSRRAMDIRTQLRSRRLDPKQVVQLEKEYEELVQKRLDIILDRKTQTEQQVPSKQDPFAYVKPEPKGIGDVQDPQQKMAQLAQRSKKGPLANVGAGLKAFIKGEPEPMDEEQQAINPRALGVANFQRLVKANMGNIPTVSLEFIRPEENFKLDQKGLDLISDYYDGLESDQAKNYFIYRVLPSGDETRKVLKQLGWFTQQVQPSLPGIPTQGELPLQEKKKSNNNDLEAGDIKVARELQKLRAEYPTATSDLEAVARAEIDSAERNRRQLSAIRGANEKQDALLKQLVDLDQEQGREISGLDKENNSLEQRLAQVQATNDRLQQAVSTITGTKKAAAKPQKIATQGSADIARGGIIDLGTPATSAPDTTSTTKSKSTTSPALGSMAQQLGGFSNVNPLKSIKSTRTTDTDTESEPAPSIRQAANDPESQPQKVSGSDIREHGGGIGPRQHWQSMMPEGQPQELINRYLAIDAETDVEAVRKAIQAISRDPALGANSKSRLLGQIGMIIRRHRLPIGRSYYQFMQQYMEAVELDRNRVVGYPQDPATVKHRLDTAKAILGNPRSDADSRREAAAIVAKLEKKVVAETVTDVKSGMARIYRRLAPKIERHRDSFLAGQLYDELENYAELHGAEREFKQMMNGARNRAHMEYDTNPGGFHNWFWFLPFADDNMTEGTDDVKKRMSKLEALALAANRAGDDAKCKMYQQKIQSLKQKLSQSMNEFDASGYDRYSIYMDDYDLEEKFSDLDDAVDAIEAYKRDDPKSRYADYNVRDLDGKVVWRNDAWQDIQKPGKIQFLPPKTETIDSQASTNAGSPKDSPMTQQQWMQSIKQQYPGVKFAQNKTTMQIFAMAPGKGKVGTFDPRQQVNELELADLVRPGAQTNTPPRRAYSIALQGRPGKDFIAEHAWDALQSVFPREYPVNSDAAEQKVAEVTKRGSAIVKTGIASEDIADSYVAKLAAKRVPAQCWRIVGGELEEATGDGRFDSMMTRISNDPWTRLNADPNWEYEIEELVDRHIEPWLLAMERSGMPITRDNETLNPGWRKRYEQVANKLAQEFLTSRGLNPRDPDLLGKIRFAIDSHTDQSRNVAGQLSAYSELPLARYAGDFDADGMTANMRDAMVGFIRTDDDDDDEPPTRPRPDADPRRLDPGNMEESSKPGEYYVHTVYFKDGTKKRIRVTSDEVDVADYYTKRGKAVDRVDYDFQLHSDMTEQFAMPGTTIPRKSVIQGFTVFYNPKTRLVSITRGGDSEEAAIEQARIGTPSLKNFRLAADRLITKIESDLNEGREIQTREDFIRERDRLLRMIGVETDPANKQILKSAIRQLENRAENEGWITIQSRMVREDSDNGEAVEMAIMRRMLVAHTDLIIEFGLDKVVNAIEEVAYNVGDTDEIGTSDVSGWVRQVKQILGADS